MGSLASAGGSPRPDSEDGGSEVTELYVQARAALGRLKNEDGATAIEYALMLALIAVVIIVAVAFLGRSTSNAFTSMTFEAP